MGHPQKFAPPLRGVRSTNLVPQFTQVGRQYSPSRATASKAACCTLVLAMPVSWKGTLQQYAGRLHRDHEGKTDVRIIDFVDTSHPALLRMWDKRQAGYRTMGYRLGENVSADCADSGSS